MDLAPRSWLAHAERYAIIGLGLGAGAMAVLIVARPAVVDAFGGWAWAIVRTTTFCLAVGGTGVVVGEWYDRWEHRRRRSLHWRRIQATVHRMLLERMTIDAMTLAAESDTLVEDAQEVLGELLAGGHLEIVPGSQGKLLWAQRAEG